MKPLQSIQGLFHTLTFPSRGAKSLTEVAQQLRAAVHYNSYRVCHVDGLHISRQLFISAPTRTVAQAFAEQLYGDAWFLSCVKV